MSDSEINIPTKIEYETIHVDKNGNLIVKVKSRTEDEVLAFSKLNLDELWKDLIDYDSWRVRYCESNRRSKLLHTFREGVLDVNTIEYSIRLRLQEVK
ncbi:MAG: hypothetical protein DRZ76_03930 [Candidatus Nealsonbacteria bacterium]|nr:MAG: hypothetical protein DRZ76_03930 [Candidatus Nealsonbacteria bacterium]